MEMGTTPHLLARWAGTFVFYPDPSIAGLLNEFSYLLRSLISRPNIDCEAFPMFTTNIVLSTGS